MIIKCDQPVTIHDKIIPAGQEFEASEKQIQAIKKGGGHITVAEKDSAEKKTGAVEKR